MNLSNPLHTQKLRVIGFFFLCFTLGILILLFKWQILDNEQFIAIANERYKEVKIPSVRGSILAADGSTLAYSEPRFDFYVWLPEIELAEKSNVQTREEFTTKVASTLTVDQKAISDKLSSGLIWIKIADKITLEQRNKLLSLKLDSNPKRSLQGIANNNFEQKNKRIYPEGSLASQVLGYVNISEEKGVWGLEQYWDGLLQPQEGLQSNEFDSFGNLITLDSSAQVDAKAGATLYTTIDKTLQAILQQKLKEGQEKYQAKSTTGIIMDPKTGAILAMANYPAFDPNKYYEEKDPSVFGNKAISSPYEIASVGKVFTLSAALDLERIQPNTVVLPNGHMGCEIISPNPGPNDKCTRSHETNKDNSKIIDCICTYNRRPVRDPINATQALVYSDNVAFRHIALTMSYPEFHDYLQKFGAGSATNIELAGESFAFLKDGQKWNYADQGVYSYGHGYSITPIEAITAVAAVDNNGERLQPFIVSKVVDADNKVTNFNPKVVAKVISPQTADKVVTTMHKVYLNQLIEKKYKYLSKYYIGLKSGTALVPYEDRPGYSDEINTTLVGFDASPERKFILLIKLEKPQQGSLSIENARPLWIDTFEAIKDHLGVPAYNAQ